MKTKLFVGLLFALGLVNACAPVTIVDGPGTPRIAGGATYLIKQDFEGRGYDNGERWVEVAGTPDEDYTRVALAGSQSLLLNGTSASQRVDSPAFTGTADAKGYFLWRPADMPSGTEAIATIFNGSTFLFNIDCGATGALRVSGSVNSAFTVTTASAGRTYHVWWRYVAGSGANAGYSVAFSADGVKPTTGDAFTEVMDGSETASANKLRFKCDTGTTAIWIIDKVRVDDANIGNNPP